MARFTKFYLDKRNAKLMGVCAGVADYFGLDRLVIRVLFVLSVMFGGPFPIIVYLVMGWIADAKPVDLYDQPREEQQFWREVRMGPGGAMRDVRGRFRDLDRRMRDIEAYYTSSNGSRRLSDEIDRLR
jgi:phage shock protein C